MDVKTRANADELAEGLTELIRAHRILEMEGVR